MPPFAVEIADLAGLQVERIVHAVQQRTFPHARRAEQPADLSDDAFPDERAGPLVLRRYENRFIAQPGVRGKARLRFRLVDEVQFINHDQRMNPLPFADDQKTVKHPQPRFRIRGCEDDQDLIQIRDQNLPVRNLRPSPLLIRAADQASDLVGGDNQDVATAQPGAPPVPPERGGASSGGLHGLKQRFP